MTTHTHAQSQTTVTVPEDLLEKLMERSESLLAAHEELEDFYFSKNPEVIKKLREARDAHSQGHLVPFAELKRRYVQD